jgi:hypothetical protein
MIARVVPAACPKDGLMDVLSFVVKPVGLGTSTTSSFRESHFPLLNNMQDLICNPCDMAQVHAVAKECLLR